MGPWSYQQARIDITLVPYACLLFSGPFHFFPLSPAVLHFLWQVGCGGWKMVYDVALSVWLHSPVFNIHLASTSPIHSRSPAHFVAGRVWRRGLCLAVDVLGSMLLALLSHTSLSRSPPLLVAGRVLRIVGRLTCEELNVSPAGGTLHIICRCCGLPMRISIFMAYPFSSPPFNFPSVYCLFWPFPSSPHNPQ